MHSNVFDFKEIVQDLSKMLLTQKKEINDLQATVKSMNLKLTTKTEAPGIWICALQII